MIPSRRRVSLRAICNCMSKILIGSLKLIDFDKKRSNGQGRGVISAGTDLDRFEQQFQRPTDTATGKIHG